MGLLALSLGCGGSVSGLDASEDANRGEDADIAEPLCDPETGLAAPVPTCSPEYPCVRLGNEVVGERLTDPTPRPNCEGLGLSTWEDSESDRTACVATPPGASPDSRRPLILYFHPGGEGGAETLSSTQLVARHASYDLSGDPERPGFVLAAIHGRNLHHPTVAPRDGRHHDFYFRDLGYPSTNPDIAVVDRLVASFSEVTDPERIYVMGWSNGGFFGQLYAIARHEDQGAGFQIAAASVFATGNPFGAIEHNPFTDLPLTEPRCAIEGVPTSGVPIQLVYRTCDLPVPCNESQSSCFGEEPGYQTAQWLRDASRVLNITPLLINGLEASGRLNADATECHDFGGGCPSTTSCAATPNAVDCLCFFNHVIWPDGIRDRDGSPQGLDREADMLAFLRDHPRSIRSAAAEGR
ncbi:MAG: hypothetical protein AAGE52_03735 [Myxococcota bacterium]